MTDHADPIRRSDAETIRYALHRARAKSAHTFDSGPCQGPDLCLACANQAALGATERLVAERKQAIDERDAWDREAYEAGRREMETQVKLRQAIDALREIAALKSGTLSYPGKHVSDIARAALLSLGEQP